jgi:hypothetical protein
MRICYLDESGHCGKKYNPNQPVETVAGVITDASKLFKTQREHSDIIDLLRDRGVELSELKASEIYRGRNDWTDEDPEFRAEVIGVLLEWAAERSCKFLICPISSEEFFKRKAEGCEFSERFSYPYEAAAMNAVLAVQRDNRTKKKNKGRTLMVFDEQKGHDEGLLKLLANDLSYTDGYTQYKAPPRAKAPPRLDQIVDVPHFSKSHQTVMIQLADLVAFVASKHIAFACLEAKEKYEGEAERIASWNKQLIDPPGKDPLCKYFKALRPAGWTANSMACAS